MKKFAQILILVILSVTVFFTGAGVTIINYCCSSCSEQTLFVTQHHVCCLQDSSTNDEDSCCDESYKETVNKSCEHGQSYEKIDHCTASRLAIDIDSASFRPHVIAPFFWISDVQLIQSILLLSNKIEVSDNYALFDRPPEIPPREYLSMIRVLII
ncbi:hypothetical protein [Dysgonomonas sp. BGC7]|uniref:hypothetical protein n=1 Tax=Dysgonomonas sp. BGC7 TaxID=1658008 RepID=UPI0006803B7D|nr:hypothetical protein [Dysgonomonas sp. BGC7]MBD8387989.1 hypothetical protein [Dysgonomonas sp. BGC7]